MREALGLFVADITSFKSMMRVCLCPISDEVSEMHKGQATAQSHTPWIHLQAFWCLSPLSVYLPFPSLPPHPFSKGPKQPWALTTKEPSREPQSGRLCSQVASWRRHLHHETNTQAHDPHKMKEARKGAPESGGATVCRPSHYLAPWLSSLCLVIWDQRSSWEQIVKERDKTKER